MSAAHYGKGDVLDGALFWSYARVLQTCSLAERERARPASALLEGGQLLVLGG